MELLVIEDDLVIGKALRQGFCEAGHGCVWAKQGDRGLTLAASQKFDAIVLDIMLPGTNGLDLLRALRGQGIHTPVILLTALGSVEERSTIWLRNPCAEASTDALVSEPLGGALYAYGSRPGAVVPKLVTR